MRLHWAPQQDVLRHESSPRVCRHRAGIDVVAGMAYNPLLGAMKGVPLLENRCHGTDTYYGKPTRCRSLFF
jgi:hypothetical protein